MNDESTSDKNIKKPLTGREISLWVVLFVIMLAVAMLITSRNGWFGWPSKIVLALAATGLVFFVRWMFCWRNFKRGMFAVACALTLVALFYAEENWRGKHAWKKYQQEWNAKGEKFDFNDFVPPAVEDAKNAAMAPVFEVTRHLVSRQWRQEHQKYDSWTKASTWDPPQIDPLDTSMAIDILYRSESPNLGDWRQAQAADLRAWQEYYRGLAAKTNLFPVAPQPQSPAQDVLLALGVYHPLFQDLRQALQRPAGRFPLDYDNEDPAEILLPHLAALKRAGMVLDLHALAGLNAGQPDNAFDDVKLGFQLAGMVRTEPFIITHLVRLAMLRNALQPVWEGLRQHQWSDARLSQLDAELAKLDFLADYQLSLRGERAADVKIVDWLEKKRARYWDIFGMLSAAEAGPMNDFGNALTAYLMPHGWYYQNEIAIVEFQRQWNLPAVDAAGQIVSPRMFALGAEAAEQKLKPNPRNLFARLLLPALGTYGKRVAEGQSAINLARIALALERYRLAHGEYPETLAPLAPEFITQVPHDVIGGRPLRYRRETDGKFILYSIGWNETDDGGTVTMSANKSKSENSVGLDYDGGDWVWRY